MDIVFAEKDRTGPQTATQGWGLPEDDPLTLAIRARVADPDDVLAAAFRRRRSCSGYSDWRGLRRARSRSARRHGRDCRHRTERSARSGTAFLQRHRQPAGLAASGQGDWQASTWSMKAMPLSGACRPWWPVATRSIQPGQRSTTGLAESVDHCRQGLRLHRLSGLVAKAGALCHRRRRHRGGPGWSRLALRRRTRSDLAL